MAEHASGGSPQAGPPRTRFARQIPIYLGAASFGGLVQFACVPVFAGVLGPGAYGHLSIAVATADVLSALMAVGGDVVLARFWFDSPTDAERRRFAQRWISLLACWSLLVAMLAHAGVVLAGPLLDGPLRELLPPAIYALVPAQLTMLAAQLLRNELRPWSFALASVARTVARAAGSLTGLLVFEAGATGLLLGAVAGELAACALAVMLVRFPLLGRFRLAPLAPMLRFGAPVVPASFAFLAYSSVDRLVLAAGQPAEVVGAYAIAGALAMPMLFVQAALAQVWITEISRRHAEDDKRARRIVATGIELALLLYGLMALGLGSSAGVLVELIAGPGYSIAAGVVPLVALATAFNCTSAFSASGATLARKSARAPAITLGALVIEIVALFALVPSLGITGAAIGCAAGYLAMTAGYLHYSQSVCPVRLPRAALSTELVALAAASGMLCAGSRDSALAVACLVAVVFAVRVLHLLRGRPDARAG